MNGVDGTFGFMTFNGYVRHISPEARTIGILTQPFEDTTQLRGADSTSTTIDRCRIAVNSLVKFIHGRHPLATVRIHNKPSDTIALTYARMIMANQTVAGISSFGVFPAIATFGTGYIRKPDYDRAPNSWLIFPPIDQIADNIVLFDEPKRITTGAIGQLWQEEGEEGVLKWFWDDEVTIRGTVNESSQAETLTREDDLNTSSIVQDSDIVEGGHDTTPPYNEAELELLDLTMLMERSDRREFRDVKMVSPEGPLRKH
jgi:hypothetical protein